MQEDEKDNNYVREPSGDEGTKIHANILQINQQSDRSGPWQQTVTELAQEEDEIGMAQTVPVQQRA